VSEAHRRTVLKDERALKNTNDVTKKGLPTIFPLSSLWNPKCCRRARGHCRHHPDTCRCPRPTLTTTIRLPTSAQLRATVASHSMLGCRKSSPHYMLTAARRTSAASSSVHFQSAVTHHHISTCHPSPPHPAFYHPARSFASYARLRSKKTTPSTTHHATTSATKNNATLRAQGVELRRHRRSSLSVCWQCCHRCHFNAHFSAFGIRRSAFGVRRRTVCYPAIARSKYVHWKGRRVGVGRRT